MESRQLLKNVRIESYVGRHMYSWKSFELECVFGELLYSLECYTTEESVD